MLNEVYILVPLLRKLWGNHIDNCKWCACRCLTVRAYRMHTCVGGAGLDVAPQTAAQPEAQPALRSWKAVSASCARKLSYQTCSWARGLDTILVLVTHKTTGQYCYVSLYMYIQNSCQHAPLQESRLNHLNPPRCNKCDLSHMLIKWTQNSNI